MKRSKQAQSKARARKAKDLELKQAIHDRDEWKCVVPESEYGKHGGALQAAHIFPKGKWRKMRHLEDNLLSMCWRHHFHWAHKDPIGFTDWVRSTYPDRIARLEEAKNA